MAITEAKKLSLKEMGCPGAVEKIGKLLAVFDIEANSYNVKETQYGESVCIIGDITGINYEDGTVFNAPAVYLPGDAGWSVKNMLDNRKDMDKPVSFQCQVSVAATSAGEGWTYVVRPVQTADIVQRRTQIADALSAKLKALPAPSAKSAHGTSKKAA